VPRARGAAEAAGGAAGVGALDVLLAAAAGGGDEVRGDPAVLRDVTSTVLGASAALDAYLDADAASSGASTWQGADAAAGGMEERVPAGALLDGACEALLALHQALAVCCRCLARLIEGGAARDDTAAAAAVDGPAAAAQLHVEALARADSALRAAFDLLQAPRTPGDGPAPTLPPLP
jgi:hypothetical protein